MAKKEKNVNYLEGLRCPNCRNDSKLLIWAVVCVAVTDDGTDPYDDATKGKGDQDWNENSRAECPECGRNGKLRDFYVAEQRVKAKAAKRRKT